MKKTFIVTLVFLAFSTAAVAQSKAYTAADYDRAVKMLNFNTNPLVDRGGVRPTFLPDGRFWYRVLTPTGSEFVLVDPAIGTKRTAAKFADLGVSAAPGGRGSNPFAIAACCKVATAQIIQRITFQPLIANESYKPAFRCIPYTCTTLVPGN